MSKNTPKDEILTQDAQNTQKGIDVYTQINTMCDTYTHRLTRAVSLAYDVCAYGNKTHICYASCWLSHMTRNLVVTNNAQSHKSLRYDTIRHAVTGDVIGTRPFSLLSSLVLVLINLP